MQVIEKKNTIEINYNKRNLDYKIIFLLVLCFFSSLFNAMSYEVFTNFPKREYFDFTKYGVINSLLFTMNILYIINPEIYGKYQNFINIITYAICCSLILIIKYQHHIYAILFVSFWSCVSLNTNLFYVNN